MLDIEYKGGNSVVLTTKGKQLAIDPNQSMLGLKPAKYSDVVYVATEARFAVDDPGDFVQFEGPGEYEIGPFAIRGVPAQRHIDTENDEKKSTMYRIEVADIRIAVLGNVDKTVSENQLESIGVVDILIVPVGGNGYTLDAKDAVTVVRQVEPKIVIPVHYADAGLTYEVPQNTVEEFTEALEATVEREAKLKLKGSSSIPAGLTVCVLERS